MPLFVKKVTSQRDDQKLTAPVSREPQGRLA